MAKKLYNAEIIDAIQIDPELKYEIVGGWIRQETFGNPWPYAVDLNVNGEFIGRYENTNDARWAAYEDMAENSRM